jgi:hypothetical protein
MKLKIALALVLLVSGCRASEPQTPEETGSMPYGKWGFAFFTPYALPDIVTHAVVIDSGKVVSTFRTLDSTQSDPDSPSLTPRIRPTIVLQSTMAASPVNVAFFLSIIFPLP